LENEILIVGIPKEIALGDRLVFMVEELESVFV